MSTASLIFDVMTIAAPDISLEAAAEVARTHWGVAGTLRSLSGERDRNFHLVGADGRSFVLKFANPVEPDAFRAMQVAAMEHIEAVAPDLAVPRVVRTLTGGPEARPVMDDGAVRPARLLTWIEGLPIGLSRRSAVQRAAYGRLASRMQTALAGFTHPGAATPIIWDLQHALRAREVADALPDAASRAALEEDLDAFAARVVPLMPLLRRQVLHDDLNRANVLVDPATHDRITGVIDFGDMTQTALIFDLTMACSAQQGDDMDIVEAVSHFLRAYVATSPIPAFEAALLPLLISTRLMVSNTLGSWHRQTQPDNLHHGHNESTIARSLAMRAKLRTPQAAAALMAACGHG